MTSMDKIRESSPRRHKVRALDQRVRHRVLVQVHVQMLRRRELERIIGSEMLRRSNVMQFHKRKILDHDLSEIGRAHV